MSTVLGLDTKSGSFHWFCNSPITDSAVVSHFYGYATCDHRSPEVRRYTLFNEAEALFARLPPGSSIFCEEPISLQNGKTTRLLALAAGAIWAGHAKHDLWWHWVDQSSWKKEVLGRGRRPAGWSGDEKSWIRAMVRERVELMAQSVWTIDLELWDTQPDLYDAYALMIYGTRFLKKAE